MIKIGIDGNEIIHGERAIRRYSVHLVRSLATAESENEFRLLYFRFRKPAFRIPAEASPQVKNRIVPFPGEVMRWFWDHLNLPSISCFLGKDIQLFHSLGSLLPPRSRIPLLMTIHSVAHLRIPEYIDSEYRIRYEQFMKKSVKQADYFVCVSESMRRDFSAHYGVSLDRIRVIPLGISPEFFPRPAENARIWVAKRFGIEHPYILYVGGIQPNKNIHGILEAFRFLKENRDHSHVKLVLAGGIPKAYAAKLREIVPEELLVDVIMTGDIAQEGDDLPMLYSGAHAFIFPSFWEGWSSPPLEAMACGTPVLASNIEPHHENLGQDALLEDPNNPAQIAQGLHRILTNEDHVADRLHEAGLKRATQFTWSRTAQATLEYYHTIIR